MAVIDREHAQALDAADPLARFRDEFVFADPALIYLDGNSLGRTPKATVERLRRVVEEEWARDLISSWDHWRDLPAVVGDLIGVELLGAAAGEVVVSDSTTVNLYKLAVAALDARPSRDVIVTDRENFPTDRYVVEGLAAQRELAIRWLEPDPIAGPQPEEVAAALDERVALVTLSHVGYKSAAIADLATITALTHEAGALVLWDLSHSGGSVPVGLQAAAVDLAVGCTYKYLNGGPGAPAYLYVRGELQDALRSPIWGWWAQRDLFEMGPVYDPLDDARRFLGGTPPVLQLAAVEEGARLLATAGLEALRAKGEALTDYAVALFDAWLAERGFGLASPRPSLLRGSHVSLQHPRAAELCHHLVARGVVPDFRQPNLIRLGMAPLTTRFVDVFDALAILRDLASSPA